MNPIISTVFSADPSVHVWPNDPDTIWAYTSHDEPMSNTHDAMSSYHVFSSKDMVNWTDYGCVLHLDDVKWAISNMWAIDAAYRHGLYYLIFCALEAETGMYRTGVATSKNPQGPFEDRGFIEGIEWGQDPAIFIDDDDTPYLFWGCGGACYAVELTDDLMHIKPETKVDLTSQLTWVFEGPYVHKYNGKYYLTYPGLYENEWPECMYYATADKPLGPYEFQGEYIPIYEGHSGTNHGSVVEFKGKWYAFHHSSWMSGISESRCLMCDYVEYDENGRIKPIYPNEKGVHSTENEQEYKTRVTMWLDAAGALMMRGKLSGTKVGTEINGYTGNGYVEHFAGNYYGFTVMAQASVEYVAKLKIRYCAPDGDCTKKILFNQRMLCPQGVDPLQYDKLYEFKQTSEWIIAEIDNVTMKPGENYIRFYNGAGEIKVDAIILEQQI